MFKALLFIHILAAVAGFGPGFVFPFIGIIGSKTPGSFPFIARLGEALGKKLIAPMSVIVLLSGLGLVYEANINLLRTPYLLVSLFLFLLALAISFLVQMPAGIKLVRLAEQPPQPGQQGPPAEALALIKRQRITGPILLLIFVTILFLMVFSPGGITYIS